uniref:G-protein coupled receptors family 3 profile domain-containing protein n=1 Tax=Amphora coffeiformis TaxID=265554 RepID=A0A7S3L4R3_9STRA
MTQLLPNCPDPLSSVSFGFVSDDNETSSSSIVEPQDDADYDSSSSSSLTPLSLLHMQTVNYTLTLMDIPTMNQLPPDPMDLLLLSLSQQQQQQQEEEEESPSTMSWWQWWWKEEEKEKELHNSTTTFETVSLQPTWYARVVWCNTELPGICHPWLDNDNNNNDDDAISNATTLPTTEDKDDLVLQAVPQTRHWITTDWVTLPPNDIDDETTTHDGTDVGVRHNVTLQFDPNCTAGVYHMVLHLKLEYTPLLLSSSSSSSSSLQSNNTNVTTTTTTTPPNTSLQWEVAALYPARVQLIPVPDLQRVSEQAKGILFAVSVCGGSYALFCGIFLWYHRKHAVLTLAQGSFLTVVAAGAVWFFATLFVLLPNHDWHCRSIEGLFALPLILMTVVINARLWRVYQTLSVIGQLGKQSKQKKNDDNDDEDSSSRGCIWRPCCCLGWCLRKIRPGERILTLFSWLSSASELWSRFNPRYSQSSSQSSSPRPRRSSAAPSLRKAVTTEETVTLIVMLMIPPIVVALFAALQTDRHVILEFDEASNQGRYVCDTSYGTLTFIDVYISVWEVSMWILAWMSRHLPSAFNEKDQIFQIAVLNIFLNIITNILVGDVDSPTSHPDEAVCS